MRRHELQRVHDLRVRVDLQQDQRLLLPVRVSGVGTMVIGGGMEGLRVDVGKEQF